jgi:tetratricopeptide (TPR) repeat protein
VPFPHEVAELQADETLASALRYTGGFRESNEVFARGWPRFAALGRDDTVGAGTWLNNWAMDVFYLGRLLEAEQLLKRSIALEESGAPARLAPPTRLNNYARTLMELARIDEAATVAQRAYQEAGRLDNQSAILENRLWMARIYLAQHDPARAKAALDQAELLMQKLLPTGHFIYAVLNAERALIARERNDLAGARKLADEAVTIAERESKRGASLYVPLYLTLRAEIKLAGKEPSSAEADLNRALDLLGKDAQPGDYSAHVGRAELTLAAALNSEGKLSEAKHEAALAAEQLGRSLGPDHPETVFAAELSKTGNSR